MPRLDNALAAISWLASHYREQLAFAFGVAVIALIVAGYVMLFT